MLKFAYGRVPRSLMLNPAHAFSVARTTTAHDFKIDDYWLDHENRRLQIAYHESGTPRTARYPYIWLQDNCQSPERFHNVLHYRKSQVQALNLELKPEVVKFVDNDARFEIKWEDEHISQFTIKFLHERRFPDDVAQPSESIFLGQLKELGEIRTWGSEMGSNIKYFDFDELMKDNQSLMHWMETLYCDGLTIIKNAPSVEKGGDWEKLPLMVLCKRISFARKINYGEIWEVYNKPDSQNVAYTNGRLSLHTDMPAYKNSPEIQLLHCIQPASFGGRNYMVDGFKVAEHVKTEYPAVFDILVNTPINFREYGHDTAVGYYDLESMHNTL
jgi:gamma-butyrobetaine dioxygenase